MTPAQAIVAKEVRSAFASPIVYVVGAMFFLIFGLASFLYVKAAGIRAIQLIQIQGMAAQINLNDLVFRQIFYFLEIWILLPLLPILTMRVFAEERKLRTFELLMTSPVGINEIIAGKFVAVLLIYAGMLAMTGVVPVVLAMFNSFDWAPVFTGYLGLTLLGALFLATGVFASALTENQIVAVLLSYGLLLLVILLAVFGAVLGDTPVGNTISYLSFHEHYDRLVRGLVDTKDLVYFACGILFMLFLTHRVVESHRWK